MLSRKPFIPENEEYHKAIEAWNNATSNYALHTEETEAVLFAEMDLAYQRVLLLLKDERRKLDDNN